MFVVLDVYRNDCYSADSAKPANWDWTLGLPEYTWLKNTLEEARRNTNLFLRITLAANPEEELCLPNCLNGEAITRIWFISLPTQRPGWAKPIHQLFVDNGVNVFFQGHDHLFAHEVLDSVTYQEVPMAADSTYLKGMVANGDAYVSDTLDASGHMRVTVTPSCVTVDYVRAWLPADTLSGIHHNREVAFSYTIGNCIPTGMNEMTANTNISVFPNPAKDKITVVIPQDMQGVQISLINALGQKVLQTLSKNIDVSNIPDGIYFINILAANYEVNKKVIICR